jgi:AcrR family transcriptional regulator
MARTQSPDYDKRRKLIVTQSAKLYAKKGFIGASISDLAKSCKMSKSLIYHYYPSKEDILFAVMTAHLDDLLKILDRVMAIPSLAPEARIRLLTEEFMSIYIGAAQSHKVLLNELDNLPTDKKRAIIGRQRAIIKSVQTLLFAFRPELTLKSARWPISMIYFGMINWTHTWFDAKGSVSPQQFTKIAVDVMLHGLSELKLGT